MPSNLSDLISWLSIPSISGDPQYAKDLSKAADWLVDKLESIGFDAKRMPTSHTDVVFAQNLDAGPDKPTVLIYGHYDVQSPEPLDLWHSDPFKPEIKNTPPLPEETNEIQKNQALYARGVADDKGQLYCWIAALEEIFYQTKKYPVNIKFLVEGAEEEGSVGLTEFIANHQELLKADTCVISDTHCLSPQQPLITYGLRGFAYWEISLKTLKQEVHSGTYGGNLLNPLTVMSRLISQLTDQDGRIIIPGMLDRVRELDPDEIKELEKFPWTEAEIKAETGAQTVHGEPGYSIAARAGARPSLSVHGLWGGFSGEGGKTSIPPTAHAKISLRLVPHQTPKEADQLFRDYVSQILPAGIDYQIKTLHSSQPVILDRNNRYFKIAETAFEKVFGSKPLYELSGGSIGVVADIKQSLGIDPILMGYGLPDDNLHAPNEKMNLEMIEKGIDTSREFIKLLK